MYACTYVHATEYRLCLKRTKRIPSFPSNGNYAAENEASYQSTLNVNDTTDDTVVSGHSV